MIIKVGLSQREVNQAIKQVQAYKATLNIKCEQLVNRLSQEGLLVAKTVIEKHKHGTGETLNSLRIVTNSTGQIAKMSIVVESSAILFLEFGAGITNNSGVKHPLADEKGYGVGTYPGQTHAFDDEGWWYMDDSGQWRHSFGIGADMPMYKASMAMRLRIARIAKEVFG